MSEITKLYEKYENAGFETERDKFYLTLKEINKLISYALDTKKTNAEEMFDNLYKIQELSEVE